MSHSDQLNRDNVNSSKNKQRGWGEAGSPWAGLAAGWRPATAPPNCVRSGRSHRARRAASSGVYRSSRHDGCTATRVYSETWRGGRQRGREGPGIKLSPRAVNKQRAGGARARRPRMQQIARASRRARGSPTQRNSRVVGKLRWRYRADRAASAAATMGTSAQSAPPRWV